MIKRNDLGLVEGVNYKFDNNGFILWRVMIDPKYLYINEESFKRRNEEIPKSIENVADKDLIIQLPGLREVAALRGFTSVTYHSVNASNEFASCVCRIEWISNFETEMKPIVSEEGACANVYNTAELVQNYLLEMACNRAFARVVRNSLRIPIVSKEELPPPKKKSQNGAVSKLNPSVVLADFMKGKGRSFDETKKKLIAEGCKEFEEYKDWSDVPGDMAFNLLERFKNLRETKR